MKIFFRVLVIISILVGSYFVSYYFTQLSDFSALKGEERIEYVISTQFDRYNPEYVLVNEFDDGVQVRLYMGMLDGKSGYVMVVKDINEIFRYAFLTRGSGDKYAQKQIHFAGTTYIPLHRQDYSYHAFIGLYTYHDGGLQTYWPQPEHQGFFTDIDTIDQLSQTDGDYMAFLNPSANMLTNYFALVMLFYFSYESILTLQERLKIRLRIKATIADVQTNNKTKA